MIEDSAEEYLAYTTYLDKNKERYGLVSYEIINNITIVFKVKDGYERSLDILFNHSLKPEKITGGRVEIINENED